MVGFPNARRRPAAILGLIAVALGLNSGCVVRRYTLRTDPPGALAIVNGSEIGPTPVSQAYTYFGDALQHHAIARSGEYVYIPADLPHIVVNHSAGVCRAIVAHTAADDQAGIVLLPELDTIVPHDAIT